MTGANTGSVGCPQSPKEVMGMSGANTGTAGGQQKPKPANPPKGK